jgi:hypothetical protein
VDAGCLRRRARQHGGERAPGRGAEQVERAAGGHVALPADQGVGQLARVDDAAPADQQPAEQDRLLGVIGDRPGRQARGDRVPGRTGLEAVQQPAPARHDLGAGEQLRGHAERIADRQPV